MRPTYSVLLSLVLLLSCSGGGGDSGGDQNNDTGSNSGGGSNDIFARCATADPDSDTFERLNDLFRNFKFSRLSGSLLKSSTIEVPVYFHIVSKGPTLEDGEVPDEMIIEQMEVLNRGFRGEIGGVPTPYRFRLEGINRIRNPELHVLNPSSDAELELKETHTRGGLETLNVFVGSIDNKVLGYSILPIFASLLPNYDGIVLHFGSLPGSTFNRYNLGHTLVHEVGHWLGLFHTFQGGCDGFLTDMVSDTPPEMQPGPGEYCPEGRNSCPDQPGTDPIHNHMTYTEDSCRTDFTQGQVDFMNFNSTLFRGIF
jgi:hypothetical protein